MDERDFKAMNQNYIEMKHSEKIGKLEKLKNESKADRFNDGKTKWSLIDYDSIEEMVKVLEYGMQDGGYGAFNWKRGLSVTETIESLLRHVYAFLEGTDNDKSGFSHLAHAQCNLMFLQYMMREKKEFDDRNERKIQ